MPPLETTWRRVSFNPQRGLATPATTMTKELDEAKKKFQPPKGISYSCDGVSASLGKLAQGRFNPQRGLATPATD
jgi:hypothetical protein